MLPTAYPMTPRRRFLSALLGGRTDWPAVASATSVTTVEQMEATGAFFPAAHTDGEVMARLAMAAHDLLGYDAVAPYFSVHAESAALGCEVDWGTPEDMPVERSHPWNDPAQVSIPPDFLERPSARAVLDAIRLLRQRYGERVAIIGKVMGPWTLSYHLHGIQAFLMETITDPPRVRGCLDRLKEVSVLFAVAQVRAGADVICVADHATGDLVSPRMYREFLLPYHQELSQRIGAPTVLHICGNTYDRLDDICRTGFDAFHFDSRVDALAAVQRVAGRISLMGNVNNPTVLYTGTPETVAERAAYAAAAGVNIVGPECAVPLKTPVANLRAIAAAVHDAPALQVASRIAQGKTA